MDVPECSGCRERDARIAALEAKVLALEGQLRDLHDKLKPPPPPRTNEPIPPAPVKKPSGRKPGGQPGHPPHLKELVPPERLSAVITYIPEHYGKCQTPLPQTAEPNDPPPTRHLVAELSKLVAQITEHQGHYRTCPCCGEVTHAPIPADIRAHGIGPRLAGTLSYLAGSHGVSKRGIEELSEDVFEARIALGTVANLEQEMSEALASTYKEAREALAAAPVKHVDETGWKQAGKKRWLWVGATTRLVVFLIHAPHPRDQEAACYPGIGEADRYCNS